MFILRVSQVWPKDLDVAHLANRSPTWPKFASNWAFIGLVGLTIGGLTIRKVFGQHLQKNVRIALHSKCEQFENKYELLDRNVRNAVHNMCTEYLPDSPLKVIREHLLSVN